MCLRTGDMDEAKHLFYDREIYGVVYIPSDYEEKLLGGQQAVVSLYVDASYFLMYRQRSRSSCRASAPQELWWNSSG